MKKIFIVLFLTCLIFQYSGCAKKTTAASSAAAYTKYDGKWLSGCFPVGGGNYAKYYADITNGVQKLALLAYGPSSDCSTSYSLLSIIGAHAPITAPEETYQFSASTITSTPSSIDPVMLTALNEQLTTQQMFVAKSEDGTQFAGLVGNTTHFDCSNWSSCVATHSILTDFAASPFTTPSGLNPVDYSYYVLGPVDGLPAN